MSSDDIEVSRHCHCSGASDVETVAIPTHGPLCRFLVVPYKGHNRMPLLGQTMRRLTPYLHVPEQILPVCSIRAYRRGALAYLAKRSPSSQGFEQLGYHGCVRGWPIIHEVSIISELA